MAVGGVVIADGPVIDDPNQKFTNQVLLVAVFSALGGFLFGYDTGIVSGAMVFIRDDLSLSDEWQEAIISITILGAWIFSLVAGPLASAYGRKKVIYAASLIFTLASLEMAAAWDRWSLLFGRFVVGAAIGLSSMVIPMFIAEMAPSKVRGALVTAYTLFVTGGQAFASILAGVFGLIHGSVAWRLMLGVAAVPSAVQFVGFLFMPESARWLVSKGRDEDAKLSLQQIRGPDADIDREFEMIKNSNESNSNQSDGFFRITLKVLKDSHLRKALLMGCFLQTVQQLTGINTVMYYSATIIQLSGVYDKNVAVWMASATAIVNFVVTFLGLYLVEKLGRRKLLLYSLLGVIVSLSLLAIGFKVLDDTSPNIVMPSNTSTFIDEADNCTTMAKTCSSCNQITECGFCFNPKNRTGDNFCYSLVSHQGKSESTMSDSGQCSNGTTDSYVWAPTWCPSPHSWLVLVGLCLYLLTFAPGMGPMPWTINSELFPLWCRSVCTSITTAFNWFFNLIVSMTFLTLTRVITKHGAFALYAAFGIVGFIVFLIFLPETKGRSLEGDIGTLLDEQEAQARTRAFSITEAIRRKSSFGRSLSPSPRT